MIVLGVLVALAGLSGTPLVQDLMPVTFLVDSNTHSYLRVVPATAQPSPYIPLVLIVVGAIIILLGTLIRRRKAP
jgi:hypothetical protein